MPDGPQTLTIPLVAATIHGSVADIVISDHGRWRSHHWNALQTAYGKSPFFEYYADDFRPFYTERWEHLADYNAALHDTVMRLLNPPQDISDRLAIADATALMAKPEQQPWHLPQYYQVFAHNIGFHPNMSIVDLLFNMGPEAILLLMEAKKVEP